VAAALLLLAAPGRDQRWYSCHKCRNFKTTTVRSFFFLHGRTIEDEDNRFPIPPGHVHEWWMYSRSFSQGVGGWLGAGIACTCVMYKDEMQFRQAKRGTP
jgi:hypothetical protein